MPGLRGCFEGARWQLECDPGPLPFHLPVCAIRTHAAGNSPPARTVPTGMTLKPPRKAKRSRLCLYADAL